MCNNSTSAKTFKSRFFSASTASSRCPGRGDKLRMILRLAEDRKENPSAVIFENRTLQSTPENGARAGYDGAKRKKGSKVHMAVDTLGHLLATGQIDFAAWRVTMNDCLIVLPVFIS